MLKVPLENPKPNFEELTKVIKGEKEARRVHFVELFADTEIVSFIMENILGEKTIRWSSETKKGFLKQRINWWYRMGYDYITAVGSAISGVKFPRKVRKVNDTALLPREERTWMEEGKGVISSWEDFEKYPWADLNKIDYSLYEFIAKNLPEGMKIMACASAGVFEISSEVFLGFEGCTLHILNTHHSLTPLRF